MTDTDNSLDFWRYLDQLVSTNPLVIDRPTGSHHPHYPDLVYPVDYGYLDRTTAMDGGGIDVWLGASGLQRVNGIICTVDLKKRDAEIKILLDCSTQEIQIILTFLNDYSMRAVLLKRP